MVEHHVGGLDVWLSATLQLHGQGDILFRSMTNGKASEAIRNSRWYSSRISFVHTLSISREILKVYIMMFNLFHWSCFTSELLVNS